MSLLLKVLTQTRRAVGFALSGTIVSLSAGSTLSMAQASGNMLHEILPETPPNSLQRHYFQLELVRQNPLQKAATFLKPGRPTLLYGYHYNLHNEWLMGLSFTFRSFTVMDTNKDFALASLNHEALRIIRIYQSVFGLVGPKISYLIPSQSMKVPIQRDENYKLEIGVGAVFSLIYVMNSNWYLAARTERWRGTATNTFHGFEHGFSVNINLD